MNDPLPEAMMDGFDILPLALETGTGSASELSAGDLCPACRGAYMDYDGMLNLVCPQCGYGLGGCFT